MAIVKAAEYRTDLIIEFVKVEFIFFNSGLNIP